MSTLTEIEAAAEALPKTEQEELLAYLAARLQRREYAEDRAGNSAPVPNRRGFPVSKGRAPFSSLDVARIEAETGEAQA